MIQDFLRKYEYQKEEKWSIKSKLKFNMKNQLPSLNDVVGQENLHSKTKF